MISSRVVWLKRLTVNDEVLGSIPASSDTEESEGRQISSEHKKISKISLFNYRRIWYKRNDKYGNLLNYKGPGNKLSRMKMNFI